jgi:hypothetical protein
LRLICYPTSHIPPEMVPAPVDRAWMNETNNNFAYRCLPLNIANAHGWIILNNAAFIATWNGKAGKSAISIKGEIESAPLLALSHFGHGILTFSVHALFRTEPGYDLFVTGPLNEPRDAIQPLSAIVETDWAPFTFTMNWKFTRPNQSITFGCNEAYCMIFPIKRSLIEEVEPEIRTMKEDREIYEAYLAFAKSRSEFNKDLRVPGSKAHSEGWQKDYFRGTSLGKPAAEHRTRLRLREFKG